MAYADTGVFHFDPKHIVGNLNNNNNTSFLRELNSIWLEVQYHLDNSLLVMFYGIRIIWRKNLELAFELKTFALRLFHLDTDNLINRLSYVEELIIDSKLSRIYLCVI